MARQGRWRLPGRRGAALGASRKSASRTGPNDDADQEGAGHAGRRRSCRSSGVDGQEQEGAQEDEVHTALQAGRPAGNHGQDAHGDGEREQHDLRVDQAQHERSL